MLYGYSLSISLLQCHSPSLCRFIFLHRDFLILLQPDDSLLYLSCLSFPHFLLLLFYPSAMPLILPLSSSPECFCHFLAATCSQFFNSCHFLCSPVSLLFISCAKHFASLMFQGAGTLTGDMEVHLRRQEQPGGTNRNHQLHNMPLSPG